MVRGRWAAWSPVVGRELRAESRSRATYWLRVFGAGFVTVGFALAMLLGQGGNPAKMGALLFEQLSGVLHWGILILAPLFTADCISREKREGTIGLLFLTPLTARDILVGKSLAHGLRAMSLVLAALPVMGLPLLLGGVSGLAAAEAAVWSLTFLVLGLCAGLAASVRNVEWTRSVVWAELMSLGGGLSLGSFFSRGGGWNEPVVLIGWGLLGVLGARLVLGSSARYLREHWDEETTGTSQPGWVKLFSSSEFWRGLFRWDKGPVLDRNPIVWLQEYSWTARLTKWGWCGLTFGSVAVVLIRLEYFQQWEVQAPVALGLGLTFSAAGSFRKERLTGALELLLVTPLRSWQVLRGRLMGVWFHFFPAMAIFLVFYLFVPFGGQQRRMLFGIFYFSSFVCLPVIGLFCSLLRLNFFMAWVGTIVLGILLPMVAGNLLVPYDWPWARSYFWLRMYQILLMSFVQALLALVLLRLAHLHLERRWFVVR